MACKSYQRDSKEFKMEALRLAAQSDQPVTQVARELGLRQNQIYKWRTTLRAPTDTNRRAIIVPTHWIDDGKRLPAFPFEEQLSNPVPHIIAYKWSQERSGLVLEELLQEELWARHEGQEKAGETNMPPRMSEGVKLIQDRSREIREETDNIGDYRKRRDSGVISEEEYERLSNELLESV